MQILSKVSSTVAVNLSVTPPNSHSHSDKCQQAQPGKQPCCHRCRNSYIKQSETGKKRQEHHCRDNEFPTLQFFGSLLNKNITHQ